MPVAEGSAMINRLLISSIVGLVLPVSVSASSVVYEHIRHQNVRAHVVTVNLCDPQTKVTVALARGGVGKSESFKSIVSRTQPAAAITGTFFDTRSLLPTGDIAICGKVIYKGCIGSALCIDSDNKASIVPLAAGRKTGWVGYDTVLSCGPALVCNGVASVQLQREGFGGSLHAPATRTAVGINRAGKLLLVAVNTKTSLHKMASVMLQLGAVNALSLDGGSSTGFYGGAGYRAVPSRKLTNLLVVYSKSDDFNNARTALAPASLLAGIENKKPVLVLDTLTASTTITPDDASIQQRQ